jgi:putative FmdB family regulatory protein
MSKLILYEWRCRSCELRFEKLSKSDIWTTDCPNCRHEAKRIISAPHFDPAMGLDPAFPTMYKKWATTRKQRTKIDQKYAESHGDDAYDPRHGSYGGQSKT